MYFSEGDRAVAFADLLFDALDPAGAAPALVRLEDISADSDPAELRAAADYWPARASRSASE